MALVSPLLLILGVAYVAPILVLIPASLPDLGLHKYTRIIEEPIFSAVLLRTIRIAAEVTGLALLIGYPVALVIWKAGRWRTLLLLVVIFPLWTSVLVRNYAWTAIMGPNGLLNTEFAVLVGMIHVQLPFAILPIYATLLRVDPTIPRASSSLGASGWQTFIRVVLPLTAAGTLAAGVLVFVTSIGFFITPAILGGPRYMLFSNLISQQVNRFLDFGQGAALAFVLLALTVGAVAIAHRVFDVERILRDGR